MENEQEGIEIETINSDEIIIPDIEDEGVGTETEENNGNTQETETQIPETEDQGGDDEKKSLQNGINAERKKRKEAEKKAKELEARIQVLEEKQKKEEEPDTSILDSLKESGIDENVAKSILKAIDEKRPDNSKLEKELAEMRFDRDLTAKSKEEGFEDILDYADEIKDLVDKGLTIEQSYYATTGGKTKTKDSASEIQRKLEAKLQNNATRKEILGGLTSNAEAGANSNNASLKASPEEKAIAAAAGMTVEEYIAIRDMDSTKDYEKYQTRKKK